LLQQERSGQAGSQAGKLVISSLMQQHAAWLQLTWKRAKQAGSRQLMSECKLPMLTTATTLTHNVLQRQAGRQAGRQQAGKQACDLVMMQQAADADNSHLAEPEGGCRT
jgi:hypothetical protein